MTRAEAGGRRGSAQEPGSDGSLEAFVAQLHDEGVEAGRQEAARVLREARREAAEIVERARGEAESLAAAAEARVAEEEARGRAELALAARDAVLELRAALTDTLSAILTAEVSRALSRADVVESLLREVVAEYARSDARRRPTEIRVPRELAEEVTRWWRGELSDALRGEASVEVNPLLDAGFEYRIDGGTVEVSVDATVERVMELVRPRLGEIVAEGTAGAGPRGERVLAGSATGGVG